MPNTPEAHSTFPPWPPIAERIWDMKYRLKSADGRPIDVTLTDTFRRVAQAIARAEPERQRAHWQERFEAALAHFEFLPAGRILAGAGSDRAVTLFNCFVMGTIGDSLPSIFDNVKEAALTMQLGGGIGHDFSTLRPTGAPVKSIGAEASGPVSFMDVWDAMCRTIMSAGQRRGAMMATLRCDHPDIEQFIDAKADAARLRNFNLSVLVTDAFIDAVQRDLDWALTFEGRVYRMVSARALWDRIMRATYEYAEPGVIFIDRVNAANNLAYCETISATNPCVTGDTWVQTDGGPRQVQDLLGRNFLARVNGQDHASGPEGFFPTGQREVVLLETREGYALRLTADHLVRRVVHATRFVLETEWCPAGKLRPGDRIMLNDHRSRPEWPGEYSREEGYLLGLLIGDGTLKSDKAVLSVWRTACAVNTRSSPGVDGVMSEALSAARTLPHRTDFAGWQSVGGRNEYRLSLAALKSLAARVGMAPGNKTITPHVERGSSAFYRGFLRGFFDADGSVQGSQEKGVSIRLSQSDLARLQATQRMLLRLGIVSTLYRDRRTALVRKMPNGKGGLAEYATKANHELVISGDNLRQFQDHVGFGDFDKASSLRLALSNYKRAANRERFTAQIDTIASQGIEPVFDVAVPGVNAFDANGLLAHNCGEQPLPPHGACLLGSINLARLVSNPFTPDAALDTARLAELSTTAVRFLDDCIDVSQMALEAQRHEARQKRRIGLGLTGLADALIMCGVHYGSPAAIALAGQWARVLQEAAYASSVALAAEKGAFPLFCAEPFLASPNVAALPEDLRRDIARHGIRNGCLTSIAPTGTISLLAGNVSSGIEPVFDFHYRRRMLLADGSAREELVEDFAHAAFRRRHGERAALPEAFVTAGELSPSAHLQMQAAVQRHVDSSISKTINCPADIPFAAFKDIYMEAYDRGLKGCTTFRPNPITGAVLSAIEPELSVGGEAGGKLATDATPAVAAPLLQGGPGDSPLVSAHPPSTPRLASPRTDAPASSKAGVVYMARPLERDAALTGATYKLRWPASDHALYVTINDIERDGRRRPFEIFINTKNLEHFAWTVALTRMISAVFRRGGDVSFVVEELKAIFDPQGGQWIDGRYVPSLLAAIGGVIETHMIRTGFLQQPLSATSSSLDDNDQEETEQHQRAELPRLAGGPEPRHAPAADRPRATPVRPARHCPRCFSDAIDYVGGCWVCHDCGYSKCG